MHSPRTVVFLDNSISQIFRTIEDLKRSGINTFVFTNETDLLVFLDSETPDAIFMNLHLQPNDAVVLLNDLVQLKMQSRPYIIIYSKKQDDFALELILNSGAHAFISFFDRPAIMTLFVRNLLRRRRRPEAARDFFLDVEARLIFCRGVPFQLPRKEFRLVELLYNEPDKYFSREQIAEMIWFNKAVAEKRTIDVHIYNIRNLLGRNVIILKKGEGYRINNPASSSLSGSSGNKRHWPSAG
jgi:DNA-binding response OmpR family regulator